MTPAPVPQPKPIPPPPTFADYAVDSAGKGVRKSASVGLRRSRSVLDEALPALTANKTLLGQ